MTDAAPTTLPGPVLLLVADEPIAAVQAAEQTAALIADRETVVLALHEGAPMTSGLDAVLDALADAHAFTRVDRRREAEQAAAAAARRLRSHGAQAGELVRGSDLPAWRSVVEVADEVGAAAIAVSASSHGQLAAHLGSIARRSGRPLLVLPRGGAVPDGDAPAIFACDGSQTAQRAADVAARLLRPRPALALSAWQSVAHVAGVAAVAVPDGVARDGARALDGAAQREADTVAADAAALLAERGWSCEPAGIEARGSVAGALVATADEREAAVIVCGTRGRSRLAAILLGSTAEQTLRHAGRPVLLVPPAHA